VIAAAGEGTARVLAAHGLAPIHPGTEAGAGPLAALLIERFRDRLHANDRAAATVLLPQAAEATPRLAEKLREAGFGVEAAVLYKTVPIVNFSAEHEPGLALLRAEGLDAIAFASGSAARGFARLVGHPSIAPLVNPRGVRVACIGESTAVEARALGFSVAAIGSGGFESMLDALAACYLAENEETA
jgi:uroporphyrinogen-III synthase